MTDFCMLEPVNLSTGASPSPEEPVTLEQAKAHLRVDTSDDDDLIRALISAAKQNLSGWNGNLGIGLTNETWRFDFNRFPPGRRLTIPMGPVQSVSVQYYDGDNVAQSYSSFGTHEDSLGPFLYLNDGVSGWPTTFNRRDAVQVTAVIGYGESRSDIPAPIVQAIKLMIGHWYENREAVIVGQSVAEMPDGAKALLFNYMRHQF